MLFSARPPIYASCMTISGERTEQTHYNCRFSAMSLVLRAIFSGGKTKQHVIIMMMMTMIVIESWLQLIRICTHSLSILMD